MLRRPGRVKIAPAQTQPASQSCNPPLPAGLVLKKGAFMPTDLPPDYKPQPAPGPASPDSTPGAPLPPKGPDSPAAPGGLPTF
jgi:hypothetical protein